MADTIEVNKGAGKVAAGISKVLDTVSKQGNILHTCVTLVQSVYKGVDVPKADEKFIAEAVARQRKWSAASAGPRKSEVRKIVRNYLAIPEAMKLLAKKRDTFTWHDAMKLVTRLNNPNFTTKQAVAAMLSAPVKEKPTALKQVTTCLTRIGNIETRSAKIIAFRKDLSALAAKHGMS